MWVDIDLLKTRISQSDKSITELATAIGVNRSTFYRKLNSNGEFFTIEQARKLTEAIPLSKKDSVRIFFAHQSHKCD